MNSGCLTAGCKLFSIYRFFTTDSGVKKLASLQDNAQASLCTPESAISANSTVKYSNAQVYMSGINRIVMNTPIGKFMLVAGTGVLYSVILPGSDYISALGEQMVVGSRDDHSFKDAIDYIERYFNGEPVSWAGKQIPDGSDFFRKVWALTAEIPFGETVSYSELAKRAGSPNAARAVGSAMARNPLPLLIPCHRVIAADGRLGGYGGGLDMKKWLLKFEGVMVDD